MITFRIVVMTMGDRIKYERPVLIDMAVGSVLGVAECNGGSWQNSCTLGSCVSKAYCQWGSYTGYCNAGTMACGNNFACYVCCEEGAMVGTSGIQRGAALVCSCWSGSTASADCGNGSRTSFLCETGDYFDAVNCQG